MSQQPNGSSQSSNGTGGGVPPAPGDPRDLLRVYPFASYTPTARVAEYFSPHTTTYRRPVTPEDLYPQHADHFKRVGDPHTEEDWRLRVDTEQRLKQLLTQHQQSGHAYSTVPYPSPGDSVPDDHVSRQRPAAPLPYAFAPSYNDPSPYRDPLTPSSLPDDNPSPSPQLSAREYIDKLADDLLSGGQTPRGDATDTDDQQSRGTAQARSVNVTPSIARTLAGTSLALADVESPDPLAMSGPSPSKRPRTNVRESSPTRAPSSSTLSEAIKPIALDSGPTTHKRRPSSDGHSGTKRLVPEVIIPAKALAAPHTSIRKSVQHDDDEEDDLDWGDDESGRDVDGDWDMRDRDFRSPSPSKVPVIMGSGRTGERDHRSTFQKLATFLDEVLGESDAFPAEISPDDLRESRYFSSLSSFGSSPLLSGGAVSRLTEYASRVRGKRRYEGDEWNLDLYAKILRLLERVMREGDDLSAFQEIRKPDTTTKGKKGKKSSKSPDLDVKPSVTAENTTESAAHIQLLDDDLMTFGAAGSAAACVLTLLDQEGLPKQVYSEQLISLAVGLIKQQTARVLFPTIACLAGENPLSSHIERIAQNELACSKTSQSRPTSLAFVQPVLGQMLRSTIAAIPRLASLVSRSDVTLSESLVIQTVYLSISPLFVSESSAKRKGKVVSSLSAPISNAMKTVRMGCMSCLRVTFARNEGQRQWIIEEILSAVVKVPDQTGPRMRFQLAGGGSMHMMSALLLQMLQASAFGAIAQVKKLRAKVLDAEVLGASEEKLDAAEEEAKICSGVIDSVFQSARTVTTFLFQRASTSRANKTSLDADYKAVLDTLVTDLLVVLYRPEWPAASIFLNVVSRLMMNALKDSKGGPDGSPAKSIALDHLGGIAAKIRTVQSPGSHTVPTLDEIVSSVNVDGLTRLCQSQKLVDDFLLASAHQDDMYQCAREVNCAVWAQELQASTTKLQSIIDRHAEADERDEDIVASREKLQVLSQGLKAASRDVWKTDHDLFQAKDPRQSENALQASLAVSRSRQLQSAFDPILLALSSSLDSTVVALRSKALRALSSIITADPDVLSLTYVKQALEDRLADSSPAVRDAAVDLVGKYIVQKPSLAVDYYPLISSRVIDSGVSVRKRVVKLLTGIFPTVADSMIRADICCRLIEAMNDQDENIKAMAAKALAEILYPPSSTEERSRLLVDVVAEYQGPQSSLEQAVVILSREVPGGAERFAVTVNSLMTMVSDSVDQADFDPLVHIKTIGLMCAIKPSLIDTNKAASLLTYLQPASNADHQTVNDALLKIFQRCIPTMPRVTSTFATDLVSKLHLFLQKPTCGLAGLREVVGCLAITASHLTRDYSPIYKFLKACEGRLKQARALFADPATRPPNTTATGLMLYITALILEFCDLDKLAEDDDAIYREIRDITELSLVEYYFDMYLEFSQYQIFQNAPSLALGSLFYAHPAYILRPEAKEWMSQVFRSNDHEGQARLFRVIYEFLEKQADDKTAAKLGSDIKALIGNNQELSESGVSSAVVQGNIDAILKGAASSYPPLQDAALDVLTFTVKQGLNHPLQCMPIVIQLETSEEPIVAERALSLHQHLQTKHPSLINILYLDFARASFKYQLTITSEPSGHRHGAALLQGWYTLISEKKTWKLEFLRSFVRAFDYDLGKSEVPDIGFMLYLAENLATMEYKVQDEPMSVVQFLGSVIVSSSQLASLLESGHVVGEANDSIEGKMLEVQGSDERVPAQVAIHAAIIVSLALITKNHLLAMWSLSEDKCLKHVPGKKSAAGDKPATRRGPMALDLARLPLVRGVHTCQEFRLQAATFIQLLTEDSSLGDK